MLSRVAYGPETVGLSVSYETLTGSLETLTGSRDQLAGHPLPSRVTLLVSFNHCYPPPRVAVPFTTLTRRNLLMIPSLALPKPHSISPQAVWEKLNITNQQQVLELLAKLAIKLIAQQLAEDSKKEPSYVLQHH